MRFEAASGERSDWSSSFGGEWTIEEPGTLVLCEGSWSVALRVLANGVAIEGAGTAYTTLTTDEGAALSLGDTAGGSVRGVHFSGASRSGGDADNMGIMSIGPGPEDGFATVSMSDVSFTDANGTGLFAFSRSEVTGERLEFVGNDGVQGAGLALMAGTNATLSDCLFLDNEGEYGGALYAYDTTLTIRDSVFEGNHARSVAGAIFVSGADIVVEHTDFVDNTPSDGAGWDEEEWSWGEDASFTCEGGHC